MKKEESSYEKQAREFCEKYGIKMTTKYLGHFPYFEDDEEPRAVHEVSLARNKRTYTFRFGQSINDSYLTTTRTTITIKNDRNLWGREEERRNESQ